MLLGCRWCACCCLTANKNASVGAPESWSYLRCANIGYHYAKFAVFSLFNVACTKSCVLLRLHDRLYNSGPRTFKVKWIVDFSPKLDLLPKCSFFMMRTVTIYSQLSIIALDVFKSVLRYEVIILKLFRVVRHSINPRALLQIRIR